MGGLEWASKCERMIDSDYTIGRVDVITLYARECVRRVSESMIMTIICRR